MHNMTLLSAHLKKGGRLWLNEFPQSTFEDEWQIHWPSRKKQWMHVSRSSQQGEISTDLHAFSVGARNLARHIADDLNSPTMSQHDICMYEAEDSREHSRMRPWILISLVYWRMHSWHVRYPLEVHVHVHVIPTTWESPQETRELVTESLKGDWLAG